MIAGTHLRHRRSDFTHDAGALVAEHERRLDGPVSAGRMEVAVADAGGFDFDEHFAKPWRVELGRLDR